jgi:hypothetical protein
MTAPLDDRQLAEIRKLAEAATPGPWKRDATESGNWDCVIAPSVIGADIVCVAPRCGLDSYDLRWADNAAFIVASNPVRVLALLDALDAARRELAEAKAQGFREGVEAAAKEVEMSDIGTPAVQLRQRLSAKVRALAPAAGREGACECGDPDRPHPKHDGGSR